ncbi:hypothetical protein D3P07_16865 [Paenibacillus sp. 1011MAR3C5]|uniref:hypothetical protein n=1 Tax=Paenibacillus sp. 1011MAR3C5 TaxID=1675787 RepID=UPI000E6B79DA|nr:hypothetical protein [Paenibacillus sp. 1011MAR3C5]RJE86857.1 hypothetical protein D3P07_16865 [Paenibacillus sp. 1011MAR3C5]
MDSAKRSSVLFPGSQSSIGPAVHLWMDDRRRNALLAEERLHAEALDQGMQAMGLLPAADAGSRLPYAVCAAVPKGVDGTMVALRLRESYGLRVELVAQAADQAYWSVAAIGEQADRCRVLELLAALESELLKAGCRLTRGRAVQAATERYGREPRRHMMNIGGMRNGATTRGLE